MVKVIIQTDDKEIAKEGDFLIGVVCRKKEDGYGAHTLVIGDANKDHITQIAANAAVNIIKNLHKGNEIDRVGALLELHYQIGERVQKEVKANKDGILQEMSQILDGFKGGF